MVNISNTNTNSTGAGSTDPEAARQAAKLAMQGAEWTAKKEKEEKEKSTKSELESLNKRLAEIAKAKEKFELTWIDFDNQRKAIRATLDPIMAEEKAAETEETALETEESQVGLPKDKQEVERRRQAAQTKRADVEKRRWSEEDKLAKIEEVIENNTKQYRALLDEEDKVNARLEQLKVEVQL